MLKTVGNPSIRSGDQTIIDGNLVIGTAGKGIDFSADGQSAGMTSELLDDYEEGTWTPVIGGLGGESGQTYNYQYGKYTKIGRLVTLTFDVALTAKGTITSEVAIKGLPFTSGSDTDNRHGQMSLGFWANTNTSYVNLSGSVAANASACVLRGATAATTAPGTVATASISDTTRMTGTIIYFTA